MAVLLLTGSRFRHYLTLPSVTKQHDTIYAQVALSTQERKFPLPDHMCRARGEEDAEMQIIVLYCIHSSTSDLQNTYICILIYRSK